MPMEIDTSREPVSGRMAIVVSTYNESITGNLLNGAVDTLRAAGVADESIVVAKVPGAWEIPLSVRQLAMQDEVVAVIALGAVIRGDTTHDQHINRSVTLALMEIQLECEKPIALGLLTCNTVEQAVHRSGGNLGNKGSEAAQAALQMVRLTRAIDKAEL